MNTAGLRRGLRRGLDTAASLRTAVWILLWFIGIIFFGTLYGGMVSGSHRNK